MAEKQNAPRRSSGERQAPPRRNDVIRCEHCGEDYAITYRRCPFCDERRGGSSDRGGRRMANNTRGGGYGRPVNPIQIIGLVISMILIIAALFIVFTKLAPLFNRDSADAPASSSQSSSSSSASSTPEPSVPPQNEPVSSEVPAQAITLSRDDFTLVPNEHYQIIAAVSPANATDPIVWTSSAPNLATVDQDGNVTNVNMGGTQESVTITVSCGGVSAQCVVRCKPGGTITPSGNSGSTSGNGQSAAIESGDTGVVVNANSGLNVRSGPGSNHSKIASILNGSKVTILEDTGTGWFKIDYGNNKTGYVSSDYISVK